MLRSKTFVKVQNKSLTKTVKEHYLRDDIPCGIETCPACAPLQTAEKAARLNPHLQETPRLVLLDTNILLHHLDVVEAAATNDIVVLQTVLEEVRHQSLAIYGRIRTAMASRTARMHCFSNEHHRDTFVESREGESDNDRNDRAIRMAALWYAQHLAKHPPFQDIRVLLLTNDIASCQLAQRELGERVVPMTLRQYCQGLADNVQLLDMLETAAGDEEAAAAVYPEEHLSPAVLQAMVKEGRALQGVLHTNPYNCFEGSVAVEPQICLSGRLAMNRAIHGDTVVVVKDDIDITNVTGITDITDITDAINVTDDLVSFPAIETVPETNSHRLFGRVVGIVKRPVKALCGSIDRKSIRPHQAVQAVLFVPMDRRLPWVRIRTRQAHQLATQRILVAVDGWERTARNPHGHLVRQIGTIGDRSTETEAILLEHDVCHLEFTPQVLACLPAAGEKYTPVAEEYVGREDLRSLDVCSIDPPGCTDIDDALHATVLPNGNVQVGVHIADVTHFVAAGTPLDDEAANRATTVYLVDRRIDMLPPLLGTNLCSLRCGAERFAFSCIWELTPDAHLVSTRFAKSVIRSRASFTYDQAQARLDDRSPPPHDPLTQSLRLLNTLAKCLRRRRIDAGALTLASPEVRFNLDTSTQNPVDVELKDMKEANSLVEEFMLLANISVARELYQHFPDTALLRRHPDPPRENFEALNRALNVRGFAVDPTSSKALAESLDRISVPADPFFNRLVRIMTTRCMLQAVYFAAGTLPYESFWHYGLATPIYTHFTSPIRRYADVIVHRLLHACIDPSRPVSWDRQRLQDLCHNLNYRNRMAQMAQRSSIDLYTHLFFKDKTVREDAYVIRIMKNAIVTLIPRYGVEGLVHMVGLAAVVHYDDQSGRFVRSDGTPFISLFQKVQIDLAVEEVMQSQKLAIRLVDPKAVVDDAVK